jgi:hypothetical protein
MDDFEQDWADVFGGNYTMDEIANNVDLSGLSGGGFDVPSFNLDDFEQDWADVTGGNYTFDEIANNVDLSGLSGGGFDVPSFNLDDFLSGSGNFENLLTPGGVDESGSGNLADYGEGWVRNLTDESQDYATDNGVVKYYDDGRVETFGNDGRYVNYTDGNVVDYSNINDQKAPVETWNKDGRYVNYANNNVVDYSNIKDKKAPVVTSNADGTKTIYKDDKVFVQGKDGTITEITKTINNTQKGGGPGGGVKTDKKGMDPMAMMMLMLMLSQMGKGGGGGGSSSGAVIPSLSANRSQLPYSPPSRPGAGGTTYFSPTTYAPRMAGGGEIVMAGGGGISSLGSYSDGGRLLKGPGDGVSDNIPATIAGKQPARLANGEFVVPARIVSELGNGSTDAGAKRLYEMMDRVQKARRKTKNVAADTKARKYLPA